MTPATAPVVLPGVSVVVAVYNPAAYLSTTIASLLRQSLPPEQLELIFVDDGSTDGSAELLDELAARHPEQVVVRHIPNSGWPGRPRNIGVDLARHEYVFFCDADDWMPPYTLALLMRRADADGSDIVIGRIVANTRPINIGLFESGDLVTTRQETPGVFYNLTSQKLFRAAFLRSNELRFPEGRVRMEDFQYMTEAYLRSRRISIVGSTPCYFLEWRDDEGNLTATRAEDGQRLAGIERVAKIILANTEPGSDRDHVFERVVRTELIGHATHREFLSAPPDQQEAYLARAREILDEYVPPTVRDVLDVRSQLRLDALKSGDLSVITELKRWPQRVKGRVDLLTATWQDGRLHCTAEVACTRDGEPVTLERRGEQLVIPQGFGPTLDMTEDFAHSEARVRLRNRDNFEQWRTLAQLRLHPDATTADSVAMRWTASFDIDPRTFASGAALRTGVWDIDVQLASCSLTPTVRLGLPATGAPVPAVLGEVIAIPYSTKFGNLSLDIGQASRSLAADLRRLGVRRTARHGRLTLAVPLAALAAQAPQAHLVTARTGRTRAVQATLTPTSPDTATITLATAGRTSARYLPRLRWGGPGTGPLVSMDVDISGPVPTGKPSPAGLGRSVRRAWVRTRTRPNAPTPR